MAFLIRITGPTFASKTLDQSENSPSLEETKMEDLIRQIFVEENITQDSWKESRNGDYFIVEFPVIGRDFSEHVLDRLAYFNVGKTEDSTILVMEPAAIVHKKARPTSGGDIPVKNFQKFVNSLKSRLTVAQVYNAISSQGNFNFNYLCFLLCAAIVADIALVTNSASCVFASMLLSPLMEPIMCIIFGLSLHERRMITKGFRNTAASLIICICVGLTFGIAAHYISMFQSTSPYPTSEMTSRGTAKSLIGAIIVASASGVSISFAVLSNSLAAMIGNAISLSLLPPAVNCGQFLLLSIIALVDRPYVKTTMHSSSADSFGYNDTVICQYWWIRNYEFTYVEDHCQAPREFALLGLVSFCLTILNIILIIITGYAVNRLKDMVPKSFTNEETRRFYTKDIKEVRDQYNCVHKLEASDLAAQAYQEYMRLSRHVPSNGDSEICSSEDAHQLTADFRAVLEGIGKDRQLQNISTWQTQGKDPFLSNFVRAAEDLVEKRPRGVSNFYGFGTGNKTVGSNVSFDQNRHRHQSVPTLQLEENLRSMPSHGYRLLSVTEATLLGNAAKMRLDRLRHLAELECERSSDENISVKDSKIAESTSTIKGHYRRTLLPFARRWRAKCARHSTVNVVQVDPPPCANITGPRRSITSRNVNADTDTVPKKNFGVYPTEANLNDQFVVPTQRKNSTRIGPTTPNSVKFQPYLTGAANGQINTIPLQLSTVSSVDSICSLGPNLPPSKSKSTVLPPTKNFNINTVSQSPISASSGELRAPFYKHGKTSSFGSVSTIGGKFEVTPAVENIVLSKNDLRHGR